MVCWHRRLVFLLSGVVAFFSLCGPLLAAEDAKTGPVPSRIITIAPNASEIICALGDCGRIVGVDKFCVYPPELKERAKVGGLFDPDLEKIISLNPDLVIIRGKCDSLEQLCRDLRITVYHDGTERLADIEKTALDFGRILKREAEAKKLVDEFNDQIVAIRLRMKDRPRPRVLLTVSRRPDQLTNILTTGKGTFLDDMITIAGGVNIFGDLDAPWPQVSLESIVAKRPEVIVELMPGEEVDESKRKELVEQWRKVAEFRPEETSRMYFLTDENVLIPSLRCVASISNMADAVHSDMKPKSK